MTDPMWDIFISHASEDKDEIARPLAEALRNRGYKVWYDEFSLSLGDSLHRSINKGLIASRRGVVILSPNFFAKEWPQRELDGLVAREVTGDKTILPVWHKISADEVARLLPTMADRLAVSTSRGLEEVVREISRVITPQSATEANSSSPTLRRLDLLLHRPQVRSRALPLFRVVKGSHDDIIAEHSLIQKLASARDPVSTYIREKLSTETRDLIGRHTWHSSFEETVKAAVAVVEDLNRIIQGPLIYSTERFANVTLTDRTRRLLYEQPTGPDLVLLNRWLIADAYHRELRRNPYSSILDMLGIAAYYLPGVASIVLFASSLGLAFDWGPKLVSLDFLTVRSQLWLATLLGISSIVAYWFFEKRSERVTGPRKVPVAQLGSSKIGAVRSAPTWLQHEGEAPLKFVTEGLSSRCLSLSEWELRVSFGLFNQGPERVVVYDVHANEYMYDDYFIPAGMIGHRPQVVTLYQDNSILGEMRYELAGGEYIPIELVFMISRESPGGMAYAFGLLVDYHAGGAAPASPPERLRTASDCIYVFEVSGLAEKDVRFMRVSVDALEDSSHKVANRHRLKLHGCLKLHSRMAGKIS